MNFDIWLWLFLSLFFASGAILVWRRWPKPLPPSSTREKSPEPSLKTDPDVTPSVPVRTRKPWSRALDAWRDLFQSGVRDASVWERTLIEADMGPKLTQKLVEGLQATEESPLDYFKKSLSGLLEGAERQETSFARRPHVIFVIGVNGVGKTTSLAKLAYHFSSKLGFSVGVIGADTFRKAAIEQLEKSISGVGADFFSMKASGEVSEGADPSAVIFDGLNQFKSKDIVFVDTSGRLHNKKNLMEELKKMQRVAQKVVPEAPHDVWMIVDATLGQNSVAQGQAFHEALGLTGLVVTKLDGLSRGGSVFQLFQELKTPICYLGFGEKKEDLKVFKSREFIEELFDREDLNS
jgi:fused signal recognition particle receptor